MGKTYTIRCKKLNSEGKGEFEFNHSKFAASGLIPGEKAEIELVYGRGQTGARVVNILEASPDRVEPACRSFGKCGGCSLLHLNYEKQLEYKRENVKNLLKDFVNEVDMVGMENPEYYRHKVYASFSTNRQRKVVAGLYMEDSHKVCENSGCVVQDKKATAIINTIVYLCNKQGIKAYDEDRKSGYLRHVYVRTTYKSGEIMVVLVTASADFKGRKTFTDALLKAHPEITTIVRNINEKKTSMVLGEKSSVLYGPGFITDELNGKKFKISPESFYQVNPEQTEKLYDCAVEFAGIKEGDTILDAYCGTGTITLMAASAAGEKASVIGVESNRRAVNDAKSNAALNGLKNVKFVCADAEKYIEDKDSVTPDIVIMDPPRSGSTESFIKAVTEKAPERVVYVSCNPETLARDLGLFVKNGYRVKRAKCFDCFCFTGHVESVVLLSQLR